MTRTSCTTGISSVLPLLALLGVIGWTVLLAATAGPATAMFAVGGTCVLAFKRAIAVERPRPARAEVEDDQLIAWILEEVS